MKTATECEIANCAKARYKRAYCSMHYQRFMKFGDPLAGITKCATPEDAIALRSKQVGDCVMWTGHINGKGYPRFNVNGKLWLVYKYTWTQQHGPVPEGMELDHTCFNRACINVAHLRLATRSGNTRYRQGAQPNSKSGIRNVHARQGKWVVRLKSQGKHYEFGTYENLEDAADAAKKARAEFFGPEYA